MYLKTHFEKLTTIGKNEFPKPMQITQMQEVTFPIPVAGDCILS